MNKICIICKKPFKAKSNRSVYCSEKCRNEGAREKQRALMKEKRKAAREEKNQSLKPNKITKNRPKKVKNLLQHYQKLKKDILANEAEFGFVGRYIIEGVEIHEENFEQLVMEKIKERK